MTAKEKVCLAMWGEMLTSDRKCWATNERTARHAGVCKRTVQRIKKQMLRDGELICHGHQVNAKFRVRSLVYSFSTAFRGKMWRSRYVTQCSYEPSKKFSWLFRRKTPNPGIQLRKEKHGVQQRPPSLPGVAESQMRLLPQRLRHPGDVQDGCGGGKLSVLRPRTVQHDSQRRHKHARIQTVDAGWVSSRFPDLLVSLETEIRW